MLYGRYFRNEIGKFKKMIKISFILGDMAYGSEISFKTGK